LGQVGRGFTANGREVRLGSVQRVALEEAAREPRRAGPGSPIFRRLTELGFVTSAQHVSARTGRPTNDRLYSISELGKLYLVIGRDR
jgi:hypothetical protein